MFIAKKLIFVLTVLVIFLAQCGPAFAGEIVKLSSTIGPIDAGIIPLLAKTYEEKTGIQIVYEGAGTGATLEKAKNGGFDMVIVHARALEDKFIEEGYGKDRRDVMYNDFVILGPTSDPANIRSASSATDAFKKIAAARTTIVTRGDQSGTHVKELEVWQAAGISPDPKTDDWYLEYSLGKIGNGQTTLFANRRNAYTLMDRATYLIQKNNIKLVILYEKDPILLNYIAAIQVNPEKFPGINADGAKQFIDWLCSDEAQMIIKDFEVKKYGEPLFFPNSNEWNKK